MGLPGLRARPVRPAPALLQVTHQDAHHVGPEPGERLRHAGGRLGLGFGRGFGPRAGGPRVLHGRVPRAGRASGCPGRARRHQRSAGPPPAASPSRAPAPHAPATWRPRGAPHRRPHRGSRRRWAARLTTTAPRPGPATGRQQAKSAPPGFTAGSPGRPAAITRAAEAFLPVTGTGALRHATHPFQQGWAGPAGLPAEPLALGRSSPGPLSSK